MIRKKRIHAAAACAADGRLDGVGEAASPLAPAHVTGATS